MKFVKYYRSNIFKILRLLKDGIIHHRLDIQCVVSVTFSKRTIYPIHPPPRNHKYYFRVSQTCSYPSWLNNQNFTTPKLSFNNLRGNPNDLPVPVGATTTKFSLSSVFHRSVKMGIYRKIFENFIQKVL